MKFSLRSDNMMSLALAMLAAYAALLMPVDAFAQATNIGGGATPGALASVLCNVVGWFQGPVGTGIATLAIIIIGVGALMGKVSWGMAIIVGLGVGVIFGAPTIITALGGTSTDCGIGGY